MMELDDKLVRACLGTLEDARKIIEKWENRIMAKRPESLFFLNSAQCNEMWQTLKRVYDAFEPSSSYRHDFKRKCLHVFADFYNIVEHGDRIMEMCSKRESWLEAAILYGDNKWMFRELSENLQVCVDCACELTKSSTFSTHKPLIHVKVALSGRRAEESFKKDTASLKAKLEDLVTQTGSEKNEIHLAEYLLDRQNFMPTSDSISGAQSSSHIVLESQELVPSDAKSRKKYFKSNRHYPTKGDDCDGDVRCTDDWLGLKCFKKNFNTEGYDRTNLPKFLERFQKEVSALHRLSHRNIVRFLCSRGMPKPSILMESVETDLGKFLEERKLNEMPINLVAAVDMMLQMGLAIKYMHEEKVVHRDLKPQNIGVSPSRCRPHFLEVMGFVRYDPLEGLGYVQVKLIDLGDAKMNITGADEPTYKPIGTKPYIAPEVEDTRESDLIDWRLADTYSFAITCSEILTFQKPPRGRERRPELPKECPDYLREFLEKCWAKNPKSRPYFEEIVLIMKEFKRHLLLGTEPPRTPVDGFMTRLIRSRVNFWVENFKSKDISSLRVDSKELDQIKECIADIERRLKLARSVIESMDRRRRQVIVCPTQCSHLVEECKSGVKQVISAYHNLDPKIMMDLFHSQDKKLHGLARALDALISSLMVAKELVGCCSDSHQWKLIALALCAPLPLRRVRTRFGYCLWELYWSLYVTRSHLDATFACERGSLLLTSLRFKWSMESCKFVVVAKPIVTTRDAEIRNIEVDAEEEFVKADDQRQNQDRKLLLLGLQNSTLESPPITHWHVIGMYLESLCASIWKVPTTKCDSSSLPRELSAVLRRRLESESMELVHEPGHSLQILATVFYDLNDQYFNYISKISTFGMWWENWLKCCCWGVQMMGRKLSRHELFEEIKILAIVQHPNIVNFIGFQGEFRSEVEGEVAFREFLEGGFLGGFLEGEFLEGEFSEGEFLEGEFLEGEFSEGEFLEGEFLEGDFSEGEGEIEKEVKGREVKSRIVIFEPMTTTLEDLINTNMAFFSGSSPFPFPVTLDILLQIVEAMIHVHECGVVHLKLAPEFILVQPKNTLDRFGTADLDLHLYYNVKLAGFNQAILVNPNGPLKRVDSLDRSFNSWCYRAPELWKRGKFTKFVDVWSFGIIAYEIVSGSHWLELLDLLIFGRLREPFKREERQFSLPFGATFPGGLGLKTLIQKCCVVDPYARISFEEIRKELWSLRKNYDIDGLQE